MRLYVGMGRGPAASRRPVHPALRHACAGTSANVRRIIAAFPGQGPPTAPRLGPWACSEATGRVWHLCGSCTFPQNEP
jgi:hypothetical protein